MPAATPPPSSRPWRLLRSRSGQAAVELVAVLPVALAILAVAWQALLAGQAVWEVRVAARAAARANAFGGDVRAAARAHLRTALERGLKVEAATNGDVRVSVRIPTVLPAIHLGRATATSHFRPQN
jgi:Flp pilus assembly protein TadG